MLDSAASATVTRDTAAWVELTTGTITAPPGAEFARLNLWVLGYGGAVLWDDIDFSPSTGAVEERTSSHASRLTATATVVRGVLVLPDRSFGVGDWTLVDAVGRRILPLKAGRNDVSRLSSGVYFIHRASISDLEGTCVSRLVIAD